MRDYNNGRQHQAVGARMLQTLMAGVAITVAAMTTAGISTPAMAQTSQTVSFDIQSTSLSRALRQFSQQSGIQVAYRTAIAANATAPSVKGQVTPQQALSTLLANSGLRYSFTGSGAVTILAADSAAGSNDSSGSTVLNTIVVAGAGGAFDRVDGYRADSSSSGAKTDTPIIETPQSISVVTADQIANQRATSLSETLAYTPGIATQSGGFSRMVDDFMIRGFNTASGNTGTLRDGMKFQSSVYDGGQEPYGLERVEVLRGASSVLYGQVAPGGIVNAISKRPTATPLHEVNVEYGSYDRKQISADFGGPIDAEGVLSYRLTGLYRDADNWVDNTQDNKAYIAPALTWKPEETTSLTLLGSYQNVDTGFAPPYFLSDITSGKLSRDTFTGIDNFDTYQSDTYTIGGIFEHEFDNGLKLRNSARYFHADIQWNYMMPNVVPISAGGVMTRLASERAETSYGITSDNSLEYTFDAFGAEHTLLAGLDFYRRSYDSHRYRGTASTLNLNTGVNTGGPNVNYAVDRGSDSIGDQYGIYFQDQIKFDDHWILLLGGRHDWADSSTKSYQTGKITPQRDNAFTGRAGLVYLFDNGFAPYVSVSQSFLPQVGEDDKGNPLKPNEGLQYEAGVRYQPVGTNLQFSAAVYDLNQKNVVSYNASGVASQFGEVHSRGLELEARGEIGNLGLVAAYTFTDAEILQSAKATEIGQQVALVPRHSFSLWADYGLDDLGLEGVRFGGGMRYVGKTNLTDNVINGPSYVLFDAMASVDLGKLNADLDGLDFKVNARNLFDRKYYTCVSSDGCRFGEPMTVSATLSYKW
ncbi:TonB-dependent siderophore receptor [Neorhizobium sp. JUb45]|uniref:TonB-dependent siderophore receptor n=1 Tax=unclassified Neorhizobium TaxID=2629175 RepID=UPI00104E0CE2|nr:TonB-dependent siderophore receptor [Neorhizobium sp. JUb45]TCQ98170.1 iron complex outermembrane receptor protein [Neorhizobium sp. JUb45]